MGICENVIALYRRKTCQCEPTTWGITAAQTVETVRVYYMSLPVVPFPRPFLPCCILERNIAFFRTFGGPAFPFTSNVFVNFHIINIWVARCGNAALLPLLFFSSFFFLYLTLSELLPFQSFSSFLRSICYRVAILPIFILSSIWVNSMTSAFLSMLLLILVLSAPIFNVYI